MFDGTVHGRIARIHLPPGPTGGVLVGRVVGRRCATDFAAAYQQGRLVNQLNWYCQLAVLVSFWGHRINIPVCEEMIVPSAFMSNRFARSSADCRGR